MPFLAQKISVIGNGLSVKRGGRGSTPIFRKLFSANFLGKSRPWWPRGGGGVPPNGNFPWLGLLNPSLINHLRVDPDGMDWMSLGSLEPSWPLTDQDFYPSIGCSVWGGKLSRLLGNLGNVPPGDTGKQRRRLSSTPPTLFSIPTAIVWIQQKWHSCQIISSVTIFCHNFLYQN